MGKEINQTRITKSTKQYSKKDKQIWLKNNKKYKQIIRK